MQSIKFGGGGGGDSHVRVTGVLVRFFESDPQKGIKILFYGRGPKLI